MASTTRDALLDAARALLDDGGPEAVTLREVGHRAGVSHNAPYKHFADKEALLAAVAARELREQGSVLTDVMSSHRSPRAVVRAALHGYVERALAHPARFRLVYGAWSTGSDELGEAAHTTRSLLLEAVTAAQRAGQMPKGDPERLTALLLALAHGAVDLALAGHLSASGKGRAGPCDLVDDLLRELRAAAR